MLTLSGMDVWLLHSILSMILWIIFIGLIVVILGVGIHTVERLMNAPDNNDKDGKEDQENKDNQ